ncbi:MAG: Aminodeoxychorismate synthase component 1 [Syntrophorhabdus sp. PtaU1.Bin002]|nr:MAG: Aminodeoxychorismate synthase component 1 [Syntrophorhabdus sp. PtaU1.Bin002]
MALDIKTPAAVYQSLLESLFTRKGSVTLGTYENSVVLYDSFKKQWSLFYRPLRIYIAYDLHAVANVLHAVEQDVRINHLHAAGFVAYEAGPGFDPALTVRSPGGFPLVWFGVYREPEPVSLEPLPPDNLPVIPWEPSVSESEYRRSFHKIKEYIRAGHTYQVNYSFRLRAPFSRDPWPLFVQMVHSQDYGYGAFVNTEAWTVCSASPELFFTLEGGELISRPMKGTAPRGLQHTDDTEQATRLALSEKNRAENVMIVDMVRNDMGQIANNASLQVSDLFLVEKYPTLWQMTSTVRCGTQADMSRVFHALFPAASITGAPKVRTMQIIAELESTPRRIYTGTIGFLSPENRAQFNVAIRTVLLDRHSNTAEYGVGGAIIWDSEVADELSECYTKAGILLRPRPDFALLETILWTPDDRYFLLDAHLKRLADSAVYFSLSVDIEAIRGKLRTLERGLPSVPHRIRLVVPQAKEPTLEARTLVPFPQPYRVGIARGPVSSRDPFLYHKTTNRSVYEQALQKAPECEDVVLWNEREEITESCIANIVVEMEGRLLTPPVRSGLLPGIYRSLLLEQRKIKERTIHLHDLQRCSRIYLVNSVRGMWEVSLSLP